MNNVTPYLKLVVDQSKGNAQHPLKEAVRHPEQLALPFFVNLTAVLVDVAKIDPYSFANLIGNVRPKWIFDARATPRLDILGGSRGYAFQLFSQSQAEYIDIFGRLGIHNYQTVDANPAIWIASVGGVLRESRDKTGAFIMLFDNDRLMKIAEAIIPHSLQAITGQDVAIVRLPR